MKICFLFPGQGTQKPGMLRELGRLSQEEEYVFEVGTKVSGIDLKELCLYASDTTLKETLNTQLAVTAMNIAYYNRLKAQGLTPDITAGHSLGQLSALYAAGVIDLESLFLLTKKRGELMEKITNKGSLCSVKGLPTQAISDICHQVDPEGKKVCVALYNAPDQIVVGGYEEEVDIVCEKCMAAGAVKAVKLNVAAAFHTPVMSEIEGEFARFVEQIPMKDLQIPLLLNCKGDFAKNVQDIRKDLTDQCCHMVHWVDCMEKAIAVSDIFIEAGYGKTMAGLMRKIDPEKPCYPASDPRQIGRLLKSIKKRG